MIPRLMNVILSFNMLNNISSDQPTHGHTQHGHPVHGHVIDHHSTETRYQRFNKKAALLITENVGTMTCAWVFCMIALCSLPATLVLAHVIHPSTFNVAGLYLASAGLVLLVTWVAQSFIQLVLLPALMVGQNLQNAASDVRAAKTFEDVEKVLDRLDIRTQGGLKDAVDQIIEELHATVSQQSQVHQYEEQQDRTDFRN